MRPMLPESWFGGVIKCALIYDNLTIDQVQKAEKAHEEKVAELERQIEKVILLLSCPLSTNVAILT